MNAAPADVNLDPAIIKNSDIFCVNESEVSRWFNQNSSEVLFLIRYVEIFTN